MKKHSLRAGALALCACGLIALGGCATQNSGTTTSATDENSAVEEATIITRTVTFPAVYFQDQSEEDIRSTLEKGGTTDIVVNEDGSYTMTMGIDKYNELVDGLHQTTKETLDSIPLSENFPDIASIEYDDGFSSVTMTASVQKLGLSEMFVGLAAGLSANIYQQIAGLPVACSVVVLGPDGTEIQSNFYPDDLTASQEPEAH